MLLKDLSTCREFASFLFLKEVCCRLEEEKALPDAWREAVVCMRDKDMMSGREWDLLQNFGDGLGKSDVDGQLAHCRAFESIFADRLEMVRQELSVKGRLYSVLGSVGGAGLVLMLY